MSNLALNVNSQSSFTGLITTTTTIATTGTYFVYVDVTDVPPTGLSIVVKDNGSTLFTSPTIASTQSNQQFRYSFQATAADVITVALSSSTFNDEQLNTVKANISVGQGM